MSDRCVILVGVDAGGSKTVAWVSDERDNHGDDVQQPRGRGYAGPGNPRAVGFDAAVDSIALAVQRALESAGFRSALEQRECRLKICLAVAGAGRESEQRHLSEWASHHFPNAILKVTDDAVPVLAAVSQEQVGIALICGTGSFAWGRTAHGQIQRCGGWGYLFGDEGSGYAIGIAALRAAAKCADGRGPATLLLDCLLEHFAIGDASGLVEAIYAEPVNRGEIARLSELVFALAHSDPVAATIIEVAAESLAELVNRLTLGLGFHRCRAGETPTLALAGGLLANHLIYREAVQRRINQNAFCRIQSVANPVAGAVRLAALLGNRP